MFPQRLVNRIWCQFKIPMSTWCFFLTSFLFQHTFLCILVEWNWLGLRDLSIKYPMISWSPHNILNEWGKKNWILAVAHPPGLHHCPTQLSSNDFSTPLNEIHFISIFVLSGMQTFFCIQLLTMRLQVTMALFSGKKTCKGLNSCCKRRVCRQV